MQRRTTSVTVYSPLDKWTYIGLDFDEHISIVSSLWNSEVAAILERELSRLRAEDPNEISSSYGLPIQSDILVISRSL